MRANGSLIIEFLGTVSLSVIVHLTRVLHTVTTLNVRRQGHYFSVNCSRRVGPMSSIYQCGTGCISNTCQDHPNWLYIVGELVVMKRDSVPVKLYSEEVSSHH